MMYNISSAFHPFIIQGYTTANLPQDIFQAIYDEVKEISLDETKAVPYNNDLAGQLEYEFGLCKSAKKLEPFMQDMAREFWLYHNEPYLANTKHYISKRSEEEHSYDMWVNFQRKNEYNPIHTHSGLLSFVIYIQVPFYFEDENRGSKSNTKTRGSFKFIVPKAGQFNNIATSVTVPMLPVDTTWVGKVLLFKADQPHLVEPFYTSDEYRISVAGNLVTE